MKITEDLIAIKEKLKKQYGTVYETIDGDDVYLWRKLKRSEHIELVKMKFDEDMDPEVAYLLRQDQVAKMVLLYPENVDEVLEESAGIATVIYQDCITKSGFGATSTQI